MARRLPEECPPAPQARGATAQYDIELITPLFGGGAEPRKCEAQRLVREPSIRGQLRFWWRATRGRDADSPANLFKREAAIWGSTSDASQVRIHAEVTAQGAAVGQNANEQPPYVVFPFTPAERREAFGGIRFKLNLDFPEELRADVATAFEAWTNFGGLGSRTRRGCGALYCRQTAPLRADDITRWWRELQVGCGTWNQNAPAWAKLQPTLLVANSAPARDPLAAWRAAVAPLADFRQKPPIGRNPGLGGGTPGRSHWPESDSLKARTGAYAPTHTSPESITVPNPWERPAFPRALFGLPIVFHFGPDPQEAPNEGSLEPSNSERMASPLILRPWKMQDGTCLSLALPLWAPPPGALVYKFEDFREPQNARDPLQWTIPGGCQAWYGTDLEAYPQSPLASRGAGGYATMAFYTFLRTERGFRVVAP